GNHHRVDGDAFGRVERGPDHRGRETLVRGVAYRVGQVARVDDVYGTHDVDRAPRHDLIADGEVEVVEEQLGVGGAEAEGERVGRGGVVARLQRCLEHRVGEEALADLALERQVER